MHELLRDLKTFSTLVSSDVCCATQAGFVTYAALSTFINEQHIFRCHPANLRQFSGQKAVVDRSLVAIRELWQGKDKEKKTHFSLVFSPRRQIELTNHRNFICHPSNLEWTSKSTQEYADTRRNVTDFKEAIIWDFNKSLNEELERCGLPKRNTTIAVTDEMASILHSIFVFAFRSKESVPKLHEIKAALESQIPKYIAMLEQCPDGKINYE